MKKVNAFMSQHPLEWFAKVLLGLVLLVCAPGICMALFDIGKEVGQELAKLF
ncbi:hypothetical protein AALA56_05805 [Streptococcus hyointestinalis]|uniref:hypothetical protein n=1 Tax=Streptococcus hyointestinalis TaxID=1337 RepID=UPI00351625C2